MAEIVFPCPACHQNISGDDAWAGQQIQCPLCHQAITMPGAKAPANNPLVPKPPAQGRLSLNQNAQQPAAAHQKHIPIRKLADAPKKKHGPWRMIAEISAIVLVLAVGTWFAWPYIKEKLGGESQEEQVETAQAAPAAEAPPTPLPEQVEPGMPMPPAEAPPAPADPNAPPVIVNVPQTGPVIPPTHNLTIAAARAPSGRVNGKISGADFLPDIVRIDPVGASQVLRFVQGELTSPERELLVYLRLKPGEKLAGQKIEVASDTRTSGLPQLIKRWKTNPRYAPSSRSYSSGYALRIEFTSHSDGVVKGRIYAALPDNEKSVVGGNFSASTSISPEGVAAPALAAPGQAPGRSPMGAEGVMMSPEFQNRYGR